MWPPTMRRASGIVGEREEPRDALGFDHDVVVEQQDVVAAVFDGLVHAAGEAAGAAEVGLVDDPELAAEQRRDIRRSRRSPDLLRALVDDHDLLDVLEELRVLGAELSR